MSDWLGVLMSLLVIVVPLALAWWWVARGSPPEEGVREGAAWEDAPMIPAFVTRC